MTTYNTEHTDNKRFAVDVKRLKDQTNYNTYCLIRLVKEYDHFVANSKYNIGSVYEKKGKYTFKPTFMSSSFTITAMGMYNIPHLHRMIL